MFDVYTWPLGLAALSVFSGAGWLVSLPLRNATTWTSCGHLAALVPARTHLTRHQGILAPHSRLRAAITPAGRGAGGKGARPDAEAPAVPKHVAMSWAQRLKRVFGIEIETCAGCQGRLRVIASIEEPEVIARILAHRERGCGAAEPELAPITARAPPQQGRLL